MGSFVRAIFVVFLLSWHQKGYEATRYLPSIVWNHLNPMLRCKCNWFHPLTQIEIYDRFEFVCPTQKINILLLDGYSIPNDQMNLNIFQRRWHGPKDKAGVDELERQMMTGEFCDPDKSKKIYTCLDGKDGQAKTVRFARDMGFHADDIVVFFNNGDDGRVSTLSSKAKQCSMAFVTRVTWNVARQYNFAYEKNLNMDECNQENVSCEAKPTVRANITTTTTSSSNSTTAATLSNVANTETETKTPTTAAPGKLSPEHGKLSTGAKSSSWDKFHYGFPVGFVISGMLCFTIALIYALYSRITKRKGSRNDCEYNSEGQCDSTIINNNSTSQAKAGSLPKKVPFSPAHGINNAAYKATLNRGNK